MRLTYTLKPGPDSATEATRRFSELVLRGIALGIGFEIVPRFAAGDSSSKVAPAA